MILIVEDQVVFQELYSLILNKLELPFILAVDGREAIEKTLKNDPALVLMDIQMPIMNGYDAAAELRKQGFDKPIIAVTASDSLEEWDYCHKAGIDDLLRKPIKPAELKNMIAKWIDAKTITDTEEEMSPSVADGIFDSAVILDTFLNNEEMVLSLLSRFIERTQDQLEKLPILENAGEWESARQIVHMIRGAAFTMGGSELGMAASRLETAYKNLHMEEIMEAFYPMQEAFKHFKKEAEKFINSRRKNAT